jgi:hypothetical protein
VVAGIEVAGVVSAGVAVVGKLQPISIRQSQTDNTEMTNLLIV